MTDSTFNLGTFNSVPLSFIETAADGSLITPGVAPVVTSSDETAVVIVDDGAGNMSAVRVALTAGSATISATVTNASGSVVTGTLTITVGAIVTAPPEVANIQIVPGTPS